MWSLQYLALLVFVSRAAANYQHWDIDSAVNCQNNIWTSNYLKQVRLRYCNHPPSPQSLVDISRHPNSQLHSNRSTNIYFLSIPRPGPDGELGDDVSNYYMLVDADCNYYSVVGLNARYAQGFVLNSQTVPCRLA
ncbi:hypothetical protein BGHDH14_bghG000012000002001 [Blumeria hordei DH14]|uniref:Secreted effector protein n=1 Tax=Blumeria graminis f. sp. hordei (strain DH14) TaxID=546991 RepID=N1J4M8_BLUG1|nr:hypothetical protein BGHDH14_bghG000012000002001 [Blumeria hordei DH14]